jgi:methionyl-tRNA synthetase
MTQKRKIIVTASLPYANGDIHLGHMLEYVQTDIWKRFQTMRGHDCYYICGTDAHGTPVMLRAEKENIDPAKLVENMRQSHINDFKDFFVEFDYFHSTHSEENKYFTEAIYKRLKEQDDIDVKTINQAFDPVKKIFLPDRYVKGTCPKCGAEDQYGDSCDACGATYDPLEMKNPVSVLSGETPVEKASEHLFFNLPKHEAFLKDWIHSGHVQKPIANKLNEWFEAGLASWDISRDEPYFGFKIPGYDDKYFYVWLDAPIGYIASFKKYCEEHPEINFESFWEAGSKTELYHFVGKDVVYFHSLFWPAVLKSSGHRLPNAVHAHGFLTVNGKKMSKSRGTFINSKTYVKHLQPEYLRYYFASKLSDQIEDLDLNLEDFKAKVNSDLIGKVVNIASRSSGFITKKFDGFLSKDIADNALLQSFIDAGDSIADLYEKRLYAFAMKEIMRLADTANQYINDKAPWVLAKDADKQNEVQLICSLGINLFRLLMIYLQPVLPVLAKEVADFLNVETFTWQDSKQALTDHQIKTFKPLMKRIEQEQIDAMLEDAKEELQPETTATGQLADNPIKPEITIDDFMKLDLRVAKVVHADHVEGADKLLRLELDLGGEKRQVFAGIKSAYEPEDLIGKSVVMVANLKPRKMRFGMSEGMVIVASGTDGLFLVTPQEGAEPGTPVK